MSEQPARADSDGEISVARVDGDIVIRCTQDGHTTHVRMGLFNAWRALALLWVMLVGFETRTMPKQLRGVKL